MKLLLFFAAGLLLLTSVSSSAPDLSAMKEKSFAILADDSDTLVFPEIEECKFNAGEGVVGYSSKLTLSGGEAKMKFAKGQKLVFYARGMQAEQNVPVSIVKLTVQGDKRIAQSKDGMTPEKSTYLSIVPMVQKNADGSKKIVVITPNKFLEPGDYCINFHNTNGRHFLMGGLGKECASFEIVELE